MHLKDLCSCRTSPGAYQCYWQGQVGFLSKGDHATILVTQWSRGWRDLSNGVENGGVLTAYVLYCTVQIDGVQYAEHDSLWPLWACPRIKRLKTRNLRCRFIIITSRTTSRTIFSYKGHVNFITKVVAVTYTYSSRIVRRLEAYVPCPPLSPAPPSPLPSRSARAHANASFPSNLPAPLPPTQSL